MFNKPPSPSSCKQAASATTARKLIQAAALASVLVPLGSVAVETATIGCISQGSGCVGTYTPSGAAVQSNTWKFFGTPTSTTPIYSLTIEGVPLTSFTLSAEDFVTTQDALEGSLGAFPNAVCIPTFDATQCGLFDVFEGFGTPATWLDGYRLTIAWFSNANPLSQPDDLTKYILQAKNEDEGVFSTMLTNTLYDPAPPTFPGDPALGGRGDDFSRFGAFAEVPEPATLLLLGGGVAAAVYRRRRSKIH